MPQVAKLIGDLAADHDAPKQYRAGYTLDGDTGTGSTGPYDPDSELIRTNDDILRKMGLDPASWVIEGNVHQWSKQMQDGTMRVSIFAGFHRRTEEKTEARLLSGDITPIKPLKPETKHDGDPLVVCLADLQLGKAGEPHGGTPELIERFEDILGQIAGVARRDKPRMIVLSDVGDMCESTMNHTAMSQTAHNDLPFAQQLRVARRLFTKAIVTLAKYTPRLVVTGVPSNHMEERLADGKTNGYSDYGVENLKTIRDSFDMLTKGRKPEFIIPEPLDTGTFIDVDGLGVAFTHGHYAGKQSKIPDWLAFQASIPGSIYAKSRVLVYGHWHHFDATFTRGRQAYCCPALESGSNWLFQRNAEYSDPGVLTFRVRNSKLCDMRIFQEREHKEE